MLLLYFIHFCKIFLRILCYKNILFYYFFFLFLFLKIVCATWLLAMYSFICGHSNHEVTTYCLLVHLWPIKLFINTIIYCKHIFFSMISFFSHFFILFLLLYFSFSLNVICFTSLLTAFSFICVHSNYAVTTYCLLIHLWPLKLFIKTMYVSGSVFYLHIFLL